MYPAYKEAAAQLAAKGSKAKLAKMDCIAYPDVCQKLKIEGYPTLKLYKGVQEIEKYPGARTAEAIVQYAMNAVGELKHEKVWVYRYFYIPKNRVFFLCPATQYDILIHFVIGLFCHYVVLAWNGWWSSCLGYW